MVRRGYAAVYRPRQVAFGDIVGAAAQPVPLVYLIGPDGEAAVAAYEMARFPDGSWRINGCLLLQVAGRST